MTELNETTFLQRVEMLPNPPVVKVKGNTTGRVDMGLAPGWAFKLRIQSPHFALVSVREPINRFGRIGTPKHLMVSNELYQLFL